MRRTREYYDLAKTCGQAVCAAQRLICNAARLEVVPLKYAYGLKAANYTVSMSDDGWMQEIVVSEDGDGVYENRVAFPGGKAVHLMHWSSYQSSINALEKIAKHKAVELPGPVLPYPLEILNMRFMSNGQLVAEYRRRGQKDVHFGAVYVPRGEIGGGATLTAAPWAVKQLPCQPQNREAAIAEANALAPPVRVVDIKGQQRGTPVGHYLWK